MSLPSDEAETPTIEYEEEKEEKTSTGSVEGEETAVNGESNLEIHSTYTNDEGDKKENSETNIIDLSSEIKHEKIPNDKLIISEYGHMKNELLKLQEEYESSLQRERTACERLQTVHKEADSKIYRLSQVNEELKAELDSLIKESNFSKDKLKSTTNELDKAQKERDKLSTELAKLHLERVDEREALCARIKELEENEKAQEGELHTYKEKLDKHDQFAKRAISSLEKEMVFRVDQVTKMYEEALKDKETLTSKLIQINEDKKKVFVEKELLFVRQTESGKEIEKLRGKLKSIQAELNKTQQDLEEKDKDFLSQTKEYSKLKEEMNSDAVKVKWAQNKLKAELEAHKETKTKLTQVTNKLKEAKEEGEMIRANCQALIKKYQESEEMKSNSLDHKLKQKEDELRKHEQEIADQDEVHRMRLVELESLKENQTKQQEALQESKNKISKLEDKLSQYAIKIAEHEKAAVSITKENHSMKKELQDALDYKDRYNSEVEKVAILEEEIAKQKACIADLEADISGGHSHQSKLLEFTEKLTAKNAQLQSEVNGVQSKYDVIFVEKGKLEEQLGELRILKSKMESEYKIDKATKEQEFAELAKCVEEKTKTVEHLTLALEEAKDELQVAKRKNASTIKDLTRQLQQSRRQVEKMESNQENLQNGNNDSKSSSTNSLDKIVSSSNCSSPTTLQNPALTASVTDSGIHTHDSVKIVQPVQLGTRTGQELEIDKKILVDKICRLQRIHAKKNEKLEFMEEHISTLVDEIQKKTRIIQYYALREEAGMLAPPKSDVNKAQLSRHGGIMASLYSSKPIDHNMTLELSLEINKKLQAVLEDTILKNMTLKENLDTLGDEITRLNDELLSLKKGRR
ncbi:coiled-coil domain-containing protein 186 [Nematostella vectensis]|uniref:coiled-coil domain-containing protein 186 n=1 Tax=Nematostella vectensis TaxID=45351 RepID=UPI0020774913|nr:coiled-coil domain-containing protein 186 [Nematostella vectensis]